MKSAWVLVVVTLLMLPCAWSAEGEKCAAKGNRQTVRGTVAEIGRPESGYIYLNFGGTFPNHAFSAQIHKLDAKHFADLDALVGRQVEVTGFVEMRGTKPQIRLRKPEDLRTIDSGQ